MDRVILDSSAVLARLFDETGAGLFTDAFLARSVISSINLSEVQAVLVRRGWRPEEAWEDATGSVHSVEPFTVMQAKLAGSLITQTRGVGLSLGDRACLALGIILKVPVYTADQAWRDLRVGCEIHLIR
jgi:ribonuclease VapC